jgi:asparagine synthase (glutamine-hydrolysing)
MCGFAGELAQGRPADRDAVEGMAATMQARGPDGAGSWARGRVALSHRRLKVTDLSSSGDQPIE